MAVRQAFVPSYGSNKPVTAVAATPANASDLVVGDDSVRVVNTGANKVYVRTFNSKTAAAAPAATTGDFLVMPNMASTFTKDLDHDSIAWLSAAGTTLEYISGKGI